MKERVRGLLVTGPMRSGTTMLAGDLSRRVLGTKPLSEISPLGDLFAMTSLWRSFYDPARYNDWIKSDSLAERLLDSAINSFFPPDAALRLGKDPRLICYPHELHYCVDRGLHLVIIYRDPMDVIASAFEVQRRQTYGHDRDFYEKEVGEAFAGLLRIKTLPELVSRITLIRYEHYVESPSEYWHQIAKTVALPLLDWNGKEFHATRGADRNDPYWTPLMDQAVSTSRVGSARQTLSEASYARLELKFRGIRRSLGYCD